ncbi:MAG: hypothetical protein RQ753_02725 [Desulfurivibrionaceae bacterium]|nr:hypothetical protein [Desulfurivibrionaceae bacterium]
MSKWFSGPLTAGLALMVFCLNPAQGQAGDRLEKVDFKFHTGYRIDQFDWNIADDLSGSATPNILSELIWEDLDIYQLGVESDWRISNNRVPFLGLLTGGVSYGNIFAGSNRDSDYDGDNRTLVFSRSENDGGDGEVWDLSIAAGPEFVFFGGGFGLAPLLGYSYHEQNLTSKEGFQTVPPHGSFTGLDSSYDAVWKGGWLGINLRVTPSDSLALSGRFEWHRAEYRAEANWNLRDDLQHPVSFAQTADQAEGLVARLGAELAVSRKAWLTLDAAYMRWQAEDGIDTVYFADGSASRTRLNEANWESLGLALGLKVVY